MISCSFAKTRWLAECSTASSVLADWPCWPFCLSRTGTAVVFFVCIFVVSFHRDALFLFCL